MSFQGADVSGLDRLTQRCQQGAQFARGLATALEVLAAALEAMSWTGWAAAFARYLRSVVIPWVKYIGTCLERFGTVLQLASTAQKNASQDAPQISIPVSALQLPPAPTTPRIAPPILVAPTPVVAVTDPALAPTGGGTSVAPAPVIGGGREPGARVGDGSGTATTPITTITGYDGNGRPVTITTAGPAAGTLAGLALRALGGSGGSTGSGGSPGASAGVGSPAVATDRLASGGSLGSSGSTGALPTGSPGGSSGGGSAGGGPAGSGLGSAGGTGGGSGSAGGTTGGPGSTEGPAGSTSGPGAGDGHAVRMSTLGSVGTPTSGGHASAPVEIAAMTSGDGPGAAGLVAAPLGLAGVGTAALAALRAKGAAPGADGEADDEP
ncbi:hypothetical protein EDD28_0792 [Salana multivorans]|uniref:Uncharacterized protein n=1 Tax=Salana multivorans TaxID=120377 RepID=A0A3N2D8V0_9MICO|nr:hypothetical protein [Salana multivorans]ROR96213.1 hypothetical protein EDD28_0792 [Salana multivorans]